MAWPPSSSLNKIERAHQMYRDGQHEEALEFYTEALYMAKTKSQKIALHSNRAACFLNDFKKAADECTLVLELDQRHTGALMLRAQTLVTLREYHSALFDVNRLMELNPSSDVYHNLHSRLKTQLSLAPIPESEEEIIMAEMEDPDELEEGGEKEDQAIAKPKGHSNLDYSRWDNVEDDSNDDDDSDEDDDEEESQPQYRFRFKTVGIEHANHSKLTLQKLLQDYISQPHLPWRSLSPRGSCLGHPWNILTCKISRRLST
ncbi:hypothetical protein MKX01_025355 [Papaver californicum]|nr:hypothetical protein MKX01_025355 [Papaver californicum]